MVTILINKTFLPISTCTWIFSVSTLALSFMNALATGTYLVVFALHLCIIYILLIIYIYIYKNIVHPMIVTLLHIRALKNVIYLHVICLSTLLLLLYNFGQIQIKDGEFRISAKVLYFEGSSVLLTIFCLLLCRVVELILNQKVLFIIYINIYIYIFYYICSLYLS